jgi:hypothetical protein
MRRRGLAQQSMCRIRASLARVGAHSCLSAVSTEIVGGTLPEKRLSSRNLRNSVLIRTPK